MHSLERNDQHNALISTKVLVAKSFSVMRRREVCIGTDGDNSIWVDGRMASIVVLLYVIHVDRAAHAWNLVYVFGVIKQIWIFTQELLVALEMNSIDLQYHNN